MTSRLVLTVAILLTTAIAISAAPVAIVNPGFEAAYTGGNLPPAYNGDVPATAFPTGAPPAGWQPYGAVGGNAFLGVLNPGVMAVEPMATYFPAGAAEGDNVALLFYDGHLGGSEFGITQTLAATLTADTLFTLSAAVGNIASGISVVQPYASFGNFDLRGFPGYRVELLAGGVVIASDNNSLLPGEGTFATSTVQVIVGNSHPQLDQSLAIRLVNLNHADVLDPIVDLEVDFDAIALDATPFDPTEIPGDYNNDGSVDAADYVLWRANVNTNHLLANDLVGGQIGAAQFDQWRSNFGQSVGGGAVSSQYTSAIIPEPATIWLLIVGFGAIVIRRGVR